MSISGLLSTMNLPEILQWIKFGQKTGTAVFERRGIVKKVYFENGLIVSASSNDPKEFLGQILLCFGWLSEQQLNEAFKLQASTKRMLGRILTESYEMTEEQILQVLRIKIEETVYDLFIWDEGKFIFSNGVPELQKSDRLETAITIDQVMFEGARRNDEWMEFKKNFPTDDVVFAIKGARRSLSDNPKSEMGDLSKDFITNKIYGAIDGTRSLRRIILETHAPEYRGIEAFTKLYWGEFIEPIKKSIKAPEKRSTEPKAVLARAMELYRGNELSKSLEILNQFVTAQPEDEEGRTLFGVVRESLLKQLRVVIPGDAVPELGIELSDLSEKVFSSREGFLASRINGQWDVKSLVMVSPLEELESLQILKRLLDEGVIRWKSR